MTRPSRMTHLLRASVGAVLVVATSALAAGIGSAQTRSNEVKAMYQRIERLEQDLTEVQRQLYRGGVQRAPAAAGSNPNIAARLSVRITELEGQISNLTGKLEEVEYLLTRIKTRVDKLVEDVDFRLSAIERNMAAPQAPRTGVAPRQPRSAPVTGGVAVDRATGATAPKDGTLGTISPDDLARAGSQAAPGSAILPQGSVRERYNFAYSLLRRGEYPAAERAFTEFIDAHADHRLASNAQYWLGESYYVRKDYDLAAQAFLNGYQRFGDGEKAPDSLLKLGASLNAMGDKEEACTVLHELAARYPNAKTPIKRKAASERRRAGCS